MLTNNKKEILNIIQEQMDKRVEKNCLIYSDVDKKSECGYVLLTTKSFDRWDTTGIDENNYKWYGEFIADKNNLNKGYITTDYGKKTIGKGFIFGQYDISAVINFIKSNGFYIETIDGYFHIEELVGHVEDTTFPIMTLWLYSDEDDINLLKILNKVIELRK